MVHLFYAFHVCQVICQEVKFTSESSYSAKVFCSHVLCYLRNLMPCSASFALSVEGILLNSPACGEDSPVLCTT